MDPSRITAILNRQRLPEGWLAAVIDRSNTIVGRSRDAQRYVGEKTVPEVVDVVAIQGTGIFHSVTKDDRAVFTAFATSQAWQWSVLVGAPEEALKHDIAFQLARVLAGILTAFGLGLWLAATWHWPSAKASRWPCWRWTWMGSKP